MKRRTLLLLAVLLGATLASAGRLEAQVRFYFGAPQDTAIGLIPSTSMRIPVRASYMYCGGHDSTRLTLRYDPTAVTIDSVKPAAFDTAFSTSAPGSGLLSVRGSGSACGSDVELFDLYATLASATNGTFLWTSVDTLGLYNYAGNQAVALGRSSIAQVCQAAQVFGDVDGDGKINSRDALIVLSAAVGLPVNGFDLAAGDVDRDGLTNSRDALFILTWEIGLGTPSTLSIGEGAPSACPGTTAPGEAVVFKRNGAGIELLKASATTPALVPHTVPGDSAPRLASSGTQVVYECQDSVYASDAEMCSINTDGTGRRPLTPAFYYYADASVDLNPNGFRVLYQSYNSAALYLTTDTGGTSTAFAPGPTYPLFPYAAAWSRDSAHIAYTSGSFSTLYNSLAQTQPRGLWKVDTLAATFVQLDTAYTNAYAPPRWSPAGDSVAYVRTDGRIWAVPATGGVLATPLTNFQGTNSSNGVTWFDWGPQGLIFSFDATGNGSHPSLWLLPSQNAPIRRITAPATGDWQPSFRRNP
jgi:hypothetical protein